MVSRRNPRFPRFGSAKKFRKFKIGYRLRFFLKKIEKERNMAGKKMIFVGKEENRFLLGFLDPSRHSGYGTAAAQPPAAGGNPPGYDYQVSFGFFGSWLGFVGK